MQIRYRWRSSPCTGRPTRIPSTITRRSDTTDSHIRSRAGMGLWSLISGLEAYNIVGGQNQIHVILKTRIFGENNSHYENWTIIEAWKSMGIWEKSGSLQFHIFRFYGYPSSASVAHRHARPLASSAAQTQLGHVFDWSLISDLWSSTFPYPDAIHPPRFFHIQLLPILPNHKRFPPLDYWFR